ncbi:MAG: DUF86 domain-containing protein [Paludibacterium sp.]|uniref:HepT-like ribonuclease domain-containing protein n=1 Tax=Paludibacterium sp. TaxID=1917523 RepID=UPI0025EB1F16|nr:HepT-like ribonuclease domain-containing protein [Paludibacterium sp.]MBV8048045.1 DUF86 domain-containing protein [Paludibacterium sp.]MBV8647569.1 DUF86 domain-containing protein [Paludibacterium sp.]
MSRDKQRLLDYLDHILQAIARIHDYVQDDESAFLASSLVQDAVIRNFEIIGEYQHETCRKRQPTVSDRS